MRRKQGTELVSVEDVHARLVFEYEKAKTSLEAYEAAHDLSSASRESRALTIPDAFDKLCATDRTSWRSPEELPALFNQLGIKLRGKNSAQAIAVGLNRERVKRGYEKRDPDAASAKGYFRPKQGPSTVSRN